MKAYPDTFQAFTVGGKTFDEKPTINIGEAEPYVVKPLNRLNKLGKLVDG